MVNIRTSPVQVQGALANEQGLAPLIQSGSLLPIISGEALDDLVLGSSSALVGYYAERIAFPLPDRSELHRMVKYRALTSGWKERQVKQDYLDAVAEYIYHLAQTNGIATDQLEEALAQSSGRTVSQFADSLSYPKLADGADESLLILANLPLPIYITTSPYTFIETALRKAKKSPRCEFCRWHPGLTVVASAFDRNEFVAGEKPCAHNRRNMPYQPCVHKPLVYHLFGLDTHPDSLVLTEDDHLDLLMAIYQGRGKDEGVDPVHDVVKGALQSSALLLLGFSLASWSFRSLYRGLIKPMPAAKLYERYCCVQLAPSEQERLYLESYLRQEARFDQVFWESVESFCRSHLRLDL